jgi:hypothetical protein
MSRPKVIIVGGMEFNIPEELTQAFEVTKHVEQSTSFRVGTLPAADYIFVIADYASHNLVTVVKQQVKAPVIWLSKGWAAMKAELQRRSILPPDSSPETRAPEAPPQAPATTTGLSEDELWELYKTKLIEAAKSALKPREPVSETDLADILGDLVGLPPEDCRLLLHNRLHPAGIVMPVKDGIWSLMVGEDSYEFETAPLPTSRAKRTARPPTERRTGASPSELAYDRARKISGLRMGPYPHMTALCREMQKYREFQHEDGVPLSIQGCKNLIKKAIEMNIVDNTHESIFVDYKSEVILSPVAPTDLQEEPKPVVQPPLSSEGVTEKYTEAVRQEIGKEKAKKISREDAERSWAYVVNEVKQRKRHLGTILENGRIEWLADNAMLVFLVPTEFSVYIGQLESTENWGLISSLTRSRFGHAVVLRFVLDNASPKVRT